MYTSCVPERNSAGGKKKGPPQGGLEFRIKYHLNRERVGGCR